MRKANIIKSENCTMWCNDLRVFATESEMYNELGFDMKVDESRCFAGDDLCYCSDNNGNECYLMCEGFGE